MQVIGTSRRHSAAFGICSGQSGASCQQILRCVVHSGCGRYFCVCLRSSVCCVDFCLWYTKSILQLLKIFIVFTMNIKYPQGVLSVTDFCSYQCTMGRCRWTQLVFRCRGRCHKTTGFCPHCSSVEVRSAIITQKNALS